MMDATIVDLLFWPIIITFTVIFSLLIGQLVGYGGRTSHIKKPIPTANPAAGTTGGVVQPTTPAATTQPVAAPIPAQQVVVASPNRWNLAKRVLKWLATFLLIAGILLFAWWWIMGTPTPPPATVTPSPSDSWRTTLDNFFARYGLLLIMIALAIMIIRIIVAAARYSLWLAAAIILALCLMGGYLLDLLPMEALQGTWSSTQVLITQPTFWILLLTALFLAAWFSSGKWQRGFAAAAIVLLLVLIGTTFPTGINSVVAWADRGINHGDWSEPAGYVRKVVNGTVTIRPGKPQTFEVTGEVTLRKPTGYCLDIAPPGTFYIKEVPYGVSTTITSKSGRPTVTTVTPIWHEDPRCSS